MNSLFDARARERILARIERLTPESARRWGRMSVEEMQVHVAGQLRMALGELPVAPKRVFIRFPVVKQLAIYWLPWPKGAPTAPELRATPPADWAGDRAALLRLIERFAAHGPRGEWPEHPAFGRLSGRAWGVLAYRHLDHHLRQFGV